MWEVVTSLGKVMPNMKEFDLTLGFDWKNFSLNCEGRDDFTISSVRKLRLKYGTLSMPEIKAIFPHVTSLTFEFNISEPLNFGEIWELWPDLEELEIFGKNPTPTRNLDADFCGIHEEEAEALRKMDEDYLRKVQIVPIRVSLLTMRRKSL